MKLIDDWRSAWRFASVHAAALVVAWGIVPAAQQAAIMGLIGLSPSHVSAILGLLVIAGRLVAQPERA